MSDEHIKRGAHKCFQPYSHQQRADMAASHRLELTALFLVLIAYFWWQAAVVLGIGLLVAYVWGAFVRRSDSLGE